MLCESVYDSYEPTTSGTETSSMSAANDSYSMNSDYEDKRLYQYFILGIDIYRICEITDVMNEESEMYELASVTKDV